METGGAGLAVRGPADFGGRGLALGAGSALYACVLVAIATLFLVVRDRLSRGPERSNLVLTISGAAQHFEDPRSILETVGDTGKVTLQRLELERGSL